MGVALAIAATGPGASAASAAGYGWTDDGWLYYEVWDGYGAYGPPPLTVKSNGEVSYTPPGTAYVTGIQGVISSYRAGGGTVTFGLRHPNGQWLDSNTNPNDWTDACLVSCSGTSPTPTDSPTGNLSYYSGTQAVLKLDGGGANDYADLTYFNIDLDDPEAPTLTSANGGVSAAWVKTGIRTATAAANDAGLGVKRLELVNGTTVVGTKTRTCEPRDGLTACPQPLSGSINYDIAALPEGRLTLGLRAVDWTDKVSSTSAFPVNIDRTAPAAPSEFMRMNFDPETGNARIGWEPTEDPNLADGSAGSGVASVEARYSLNGGAYSAWTSTPDSMISFTGSLNDNVTVEARVTDAAGNVSGTGSATYQLKATPVVSTSGRLRTIAANNGTAYPASYPIVVTSTDGIDGPTGPGIKRLELLVDGVVIDAEGQTCSGACDLNRTFWMNTSWLPTGIHRIAVRAFDENGIAGYDVWKVNVNSRRTLFTLSTTATVAEVTGAVAGANADWLELSHTNEGEGGYMLGSEDPAEALLDYVDDVEDAHGTAPRIREFVVGGDISTASLGLLASKVNGRQVFDNVYAGNAAPDDTLVEDGLYYDDDLLAADIAAENSEDNEESPAPSAARSEAAPAKQFAPSYGEVRVFNLAGNNRPRRIEQTLTFPMEAIGDVDGDGDKDESPFERAGARDHGYEHDFKLIDADFTGSRKHPICTDEKERFWAQRKGYTWTSNYPRDAHPYFDSPLGDNCKYLDFTIGIEYPLELTPNKRYWTSIRTRAGDASYSNFYMNAQKTFRFCTNLPNKYCNESVGPTEGQLLVGAGRGARTEECWRWRKGYDSRKTCTY